MILSSKKREDLEKAFRARYVTYKDVKNLIKNNEKGIQEYNAMFLPKLPMVGASALFVALIMSLFETAMAASRNTYFIAYVVCLIFFALTRGGRAKKYALPGMYVASVILYLLVLFLSVIKGSSYPAAAMLIILAIFPMLFIDKPNKIFLVEIAFFFIHSYLSYRMKGIELGQIDFINGFIATIVGCFLGWLILISRLRTLDLERLLIIEKETDVLTGMHNRRKLFETIAGIEGGKYKRPSGVMMFDIDYFKRYNDTFGHAAGDACLRAFGKKLLSKERGGCIEFFRYGGEEFVGFVWDLDEDALGLVGEEIRRDVETMELEHGKATVSVGYVYCDDPSVINYETWIERADSAVYMAKDKGRNCVVRWKGNDYGENIFANNDGRDVPRVF